MTPKKTDIWEAMTRVNNDLVNEQRTLARQNLENQTARERLKTINQNLEQYAHITAHDIKTPVNNIISIVHLLSEEHAGQLNEEGKELLEFLQISSEKLREMVDGILAYSKSDKDLKELKEPFELGPFLSDIMAHIDRNQEYDITYPDASPVIITNKLALEQILLNLLTNSVKYNDKERIALKIGFSETPTHYQFSIQDNGTGIDKASLPHIFTLREAGTSPDRFGRLGTGIGLSTVRHLVDSLGGDIRVESEPHHGTTFTFTLAR